jgi:hypothetical protein
VDDAVAIVAEMNEWAWRRFKNAVRDLDDDEINWRPLPEANNINVIVRHLRIESQWHLDSLTRGDVMPSDTSTALQEQIDAVPLDFEQNLAKLEELFTAFLDALRTARVHDVQHRTRAAYAAWPHVPVHFLAYHQAVHTAGHGAQIQTIRNLYRKTRGERALFFPENPTYPDR